MIGRMHTKLSFYIVESSDLLCEGTLECGGLRVQLQTIHVSEPILLALEVLEVRADSTYISEVHDTKLPQRRDNLAANLISDVELGQGHVRRAEQRILLGRHDGCCITSLCARARESLMMGFVAGEEVLEPSLLKPAASSWLRRRAPISLGST